MRRLTTYVNRLEGEHPLLQIVSSQDDQANQFNMFNRIEHVPGDNSTHSIIGWRQDDERTYFTIKTSTRNTTIVENLLNGILPAFSIRTRCQFKPHPDGGEEATQIRIISIDQVRNPSNKGSVPVSNKITYVDPINFKAIDMSLVSFKTFTPNVATESVGLDFIQDGDEILLDPSLEGVDQLSRFAIRRTIKTKEKVSLEAVMKDFGNFL